jgi:hypothetical protein
MLGWAGSAAAMPTDLFFSEYVEGSSNNKALEIFNGTGAQIDLGANGYNVQMYFNGSAGAGLTINLAGTIASGGVFVLAQSSAAPAILAQADQTNGAGWFNGNDAVVLRKGSSFVDVIGQVGVNPGSEWGAGNTSTQDNTLRRASSVLAGDPDGSDLFNPSAEWLGFAQDTFDGLGTHAIDTIPPPMINEFVFSHTGTDTHEFAEILGDPNADYSGYSLLQVEGDGSGAGVIDLVLPVGTTDADGLWWSGFYSNEFENGTVTLLLVENFTGSEGGDLDTDNDGVLDAILWSALADAIAVSDGGASDRTYADLVLGALYDGLPFPPGGASRIPNGIDTNTIADWVRNDFELAGIAGFAGTPISGEAYNTPGAVNLAVLSVPEPGTLALLGGAFAAAVWSRRRRC